MPDVSHPAPPRERLLFVTGRLAEVVVRRVVGQLSERGEIAGEVEVVGISVAALMHVSWLRRKLTLTGPYDRVIVPGWCQGDLRELEEAFGVPFVRGPKDIQDLPGSLGRARSAPPDLSRYDIEIIAEINHAPQFSDEEILRQALEFRQAGADLIDLGCIPGGGWSGIGETVRRLCAEGLRVSVDSFDRTEVELAVAAGAELVLSCNSTNAAWLPDLGAEVVVIPDDPSSLDAMWQTSDRVTASGGRLRLDPILEPIGFGFAKSLARYYETRRSAPEAALMMGIGNVTELSDVDSAGVNFLLAALCQELRIGSVLTTQVIPWCQTAVREFDIARRLVRHALDQRVPPKRLCEDLVMLRDPRRHELGAEALQHLASELKDPNFRIFVEQGQMHVMNRDGYWRGDDPFELFDQFAAVCGPLDAAHAFYLGYELSKARTALTLGKQYRQDEALRWGFLTVPEPSAHERRRRNETPERSP